jgi:chorismate--pyruvate lyase
MLKKYTALATQTNWWSDNALSIVKLEPRLQALVSGQGSLTAALSAIADGEFSVHVLRQRIAVPLFHEQLKLKRPLSRAAMIREVELKLHGQPVVYARSIIPLSLVTKGRNGLANLGRTPLGHLLFKDGKIRVSKREFSQMNICDPISLNGQVTARRTPYDYQGSQILVSEFFLPKIHDFL